MRRLSEYQVRIVQEDATNEDSLRTALDVTQEFGGLDVVYHGIGLTLPGFLELDPSQWDALYATNLRSVLIVLNLVLPIMKAQRRGSIVAMSSVMGRRPQTMEPLYGAFKCAVIHLCQSLALQMAPYGIRINVVAPGPTPPRDFEAISANSAFRAAINNMDAFQALANALAKEIPLGRLGEPENAAHAVMHLSSSVTGAFQTGQVLGVDGGWWMPK